MLCDVWRTSSPKVHDAVRAFKQHVENRPNKPDWKGFLIGIFGLQAINPHLPNSAPLSSAFKHMTSWMFGNKNSGLRAGCRYEVGLQVHRQIGPAFRHAAVPAAAAPHLTAACIRAWLSVIHQMLFQAGKCISGGA